jgi:hypothetical protein
VKEGINLSKILKQTMAAMLALIFVLGTPAVTASAVGGTAPAGGSAVFSDVSAGDWFYKATSFVVENGLFQGTGGGKFSPGTPMTRGMFVTVLGRLHGIDATAAAYQARTYSDVDPAAYYGPYVAWASGAGIVGGSGGSSFSPDTALTRQDMITVLYRYQNYRGGSTAPGSSGTVGAFSDSGDISSYAVDAMTWGVSQGIINGVGGGKLSPCLGTSRAQVAQTLLNAYDLLKTGGAAQNFGKAVDTVSAAWKDKLAELTSSGASVSSAAVMSGIYDAAQELVENGTIKNLACSEQGVFFSYADGTPGGVVMELPELESLDAKTLSYTPAAPGRGPGGMSLATADGAVSGPALAALANTATAATNVIGNNKVLLSVNLGDVRGNEFETYEALADKIKENTRGLEVTVKDLTVADYKTLNNYGAVFISNPNSWVNSGISYIELMETYDPSRNYDADRKAGRIGLYSKISPGSAKYIPDAEGYILYSSSFDYEQRYVLFAEKFFPYYYGSGNTFPNSFIHLGFNSSISTSTLSSLFMSAGAGCVTGYTDAMRRQNDLEVIGTLMDTLLKAEKNTVYDAYLAVLDKNQGTDSFTYTHYKNTKWDIVSRDVESMFDMRLNNDNGELKLWGAAPQAVSAPITVSGSYYTKPDPYNVITNTYLTITYTNTSSMNITGVYYRTLKNGKEDSGDSSVYKNRIPDFADFSLQPGESYTWHQRYPYIFTEYSHIITGYTTGDPKNASSWVEIPEVKWQPVEFSFEGAK